MSKLIAFGWYGGKYSHLDWPLPLLPETTHYCEPFRGSTAVSTTTSVAGGPIPPQQTPAEFEQ
jgi:site-specific DNA-adenine methylase